MAIKYKGRSFSNGRSLANAISRDINNEIEQKFRRAASASGVRIRKTHKGFEVEGDTTSLARFNNRLGR